MYTTYIYIYRYIIDFVSIKFQVYLFGSRFDYLSIICFKKRYIAEISVARRLHKHQIIAELLPFKHRWIFFFWIRPSSPRRDRLKVIIKSQKNVESKSFRGQLSTNCSRWNELKNRKIR